MDKIRLQTDRNLLLLSASAIFFFLTVIMISEFASRFIRDVLLNLSLDLGLIFFVAILIHFLLMIFGILFIKNLLLSSKFSSIKLFKFSIFAVIFGQLLYVANPFLYRFLDLEFMNTQWNRYSEFTSEYFILSMLNFSTTIFSYFFLGFIFYKNRDVLNS